MYLDIANHAILHFLLNYMCPLAERHTHLLLFMGNTLKFYKRMLLSRPARPVREWVEGIQLFIHWHSWFSEAGSRGGLRLGERRQSYGRVTCHRMRPLACGAVSLSQAFMLCSDSGIRRHLRACQGEPEVSAW